MQHRNCNLNNNHGKEELKHIHQSLGCDKLVGISTGDTVMVRENMSM